MPPIPTCPLMSAGHTTPIICLQDRCAWYMANTKTCAMYVMAHKSMLEIKEIQKNK